MKASVSILPIVHEEQEGLERNLRMWLEHWNLTADPFAGRPRSFIPIASRLEAAERLIHAIMSGERRASLVAEAGLGKSTLLDHVLARTADPSRRFARVQAPMDGPDCFAQFAEALGSRVPTGASRSTAWRALGEAARICRWQGLQVVLVIDDAQSLRDPADRRDLERLENLDSHPKARLTVIRVGRPVESDPEDIPEGEWDLAIRLPTLTRSEAARYLDARLGAVGRTESTFTDRAVTRLHSLSRGIPRGLDRLASLALMAGAVQGLKLVTPPIVDSVASECLVA